VPPTPSDPEITESVESRGLDRRTLIKGAAIAGAAAWTAPVIIDSLASPAAAFTPVVCASCSTGTTVHQASYHVTNTGSNGTATCQAMSAPTGCQPTCYHGGNDDCSVPFTVAPNKSGNSAGVVFTMNASGTFLGGTTYSGTTCNAVVGVVGTNGSGRSTLTFAQQTANTGYDLTLTWCA
jgi:hypothetical protein